MKSSREIITRPQRQTSDAAFTLTELLVILGTLALLAVMLAPALAAPKPNSKTAQCLNNQRQLAVAWLMYTSDNADSLVPAINWINTSTIAPGSFMDWTSSPNVTNTIGLTNSAYSLFASYIKTAAVYKCPADIYQSTANPGPRARSVSLNMSLTGRPTFINNGGTGRNWFTAFKATGLSHPGPANIFTFIDEHPDSIDDGMFAHNPGYAPGNERWRNLPASYHNGAAGVSFADGHVEMHTWSVIKGVFPTDQPVKFIYGGPWQSINLGANADYEWVENHMPYHY